jgi:predicted molibdopterin-dependent oxidoreductase YjgC
MSSIEREDAGQIAIEFEGQPVTAQEGDTVAAALLRAGYWTFRMTAVNGRPRGPFCMMGVCFDCLVEIDGLANCQACMTDVQAGMRIKRQQGANDISHGTAP